MKALIAALVLFASIAQAQPAPPPVLPVVTMEPMETDSFAFRFNSWTLSAAGVTCANDAVCTALAPYGECTAAGLCVWVNLLAPAARADASPGAIVVAGPTRTGNEVSVTIKPDQGCAAVGCRNGNSYQIRVQPEGESHSGVLDKPTASFKLQVKKVTP